MSWGDIVGQSQLLANSLRYGGVVSMRDISASGSVVPDEEALLRCPVA